MNNDILEKLSQAERESAMTIFINALDEWAENGTSTVKCDSCEGAISFQRKGSACFHECNCGKYTGTMRGVL